MGQPTWNKKVKLIIGFIFKDDAVLKKAEALISKKFGLIELQSRVTDFIYTDHYNKELGENLKRKFISLKRLISSENVYRTKLVTNDIERRLAKSGRRTINIDPGYITEAKLVLLTTKDYSHRLYLRNGIYAEITLGFHHGTYLPLETTYPDYKSDIYIDIFNRIRNIYKQQLAGV